MNLNLKPSMSQSKKIIQNGLDLSGIQHVDGKVIVDGVIRRPSIAPRQNPANRQSRQNPANMPTRQIPANMPIRQIPETMPIRKNVPRQANMYCEDDLANDHHEYPQPHVRPPMAQGPTTANMPPPPRITLMSRDARLTNIGRLEHRTNCLAPLTLKFNPQGSLAPLNVIISRGKQL